jgi:hypothetical protein
MDWGPIETLGPLVLLFGSLFGAFIARAVKANRQNKAQLVRTIRVQVVAKPVSFGTNRAQVVKFRAEDGDILDISVTDDAVHLQIIEGMHGLLAEGDAGTLTFQGTRYKGFVRPAT